MMVPARSHSPRHANMPSHLEWFQDMPAHWEVWRLKFLVSKIGSGKTPLGGGERYVEDGIMLLRSQNIHFGGLKLTDVAFIDADTDNELSASRVVDGDVLLNITGASLGRCCVARLNGVLANVNQHVCILRFNPIANAPEFFAYLLESHTLQAQIFKTENGVSRDAVSFEQIGDFSLLRPPLEEQRAIAAFLDWETARIDELVAKKERLIQLLQEKRTALISHTVTHGLNPSVPMKDSGGEWVGEIPAHWETLRLKFVVELNPSVKEVKFIPSETEVSFVPMEAIDEFGRLDLSATRLVSEVSAGYTYFRENDVVVAKITPCFENGKGAMAVGLTGGIAFGSTELHVLRRTPLVYAQFVYYMTMEENFRQTGESEMYRAGGQKRVPVDFVENFRLALPPFVEQVEIAAYLDRETGLIDELIDMNMAALGRLQELRSSLISAAVTGRIDTRAAPS